MDDSNLPTTYREGTEYHPFIKFSRTCTACYLGEGFAVGGAGPDDLTDVKLIVVSDHIGAYERKVDYPFYDNDSDRQPRRQRNRRQTVLGFRNAGSMLRYVLSAQFGLDTYNEVYLTNAIKCEPTKQKADEKHAKVCVRTWLLNEFATLDLYAPTAPVLIAGNMAFRGLKYLQPELANSLGKSLHVCRRTNHHRLNDHPLVFTVNPAVPARAEFRIERQVSVNSANKYQVDSVEVLSPLPGSPVWAFYQDIELLRPFLS